MSSSTEHVVFTIGNQFSFTTFLVTYTLGFKVRSHPGDLILLDTYCVPYLFHIQARPKGIDHYCIMFFNSFDTIEQVRLEQEICRERKANKIGKDERKILVTNETGE